MADFNALAEQATALRAKLPETHDDAYMQLVWFPIHAAANLNELYVTAARNRLYAQQGRASTNALADRVETLFEKDAELARIYHEDIAGGKWNHLMSQTHIGYTYWQQPEQNNMPDVVRIDIPESSRIGVSVPGTADVTMGPETALTMPAFDPYARSSQAFDVFSTGQSPPEFIISTAEDWVDIEPVRTPLTTDLTIAVSIEWEKAPLGRTTAQLGLISGETRIAVNIPTHKFEVPVAGQPFIETDGIVSFDASDAHQVNDSGEITWRVIPKLGHTGDSITMFPVTSAPQAPGASASPSLEYNVYVTEPGTYTADVTLAPSLDFRGKGGLRYAISVNDEPPRIVNINADTSHAAWETSVIPNRSPRQSPMHIILAIIFLLTIPVPF